jgi:hypothetical protein
LVKERKAGRLPPDTEIEVVALSEVLLVKLDAFNRIAITKVGVL